ncbi:peptidoglycan editing factor PgeF [Silanimonas sp.]|uniref:peptidoglycan editing factor PgeF n=1 Tax=Silanimonas sp. TaxID=1929290 RepID=UPI0022CA22E5|nr:peptidoglycan editing factor PgeF [Silanimonas sp.]MCZ8062384.1 peptidoglycan editing factor PgeF [Silanimonas sp.]
MDVAPPFFEWANWPAPPGVRGGSTRRRGLGASQPPFDTLNLGGHRSADGDAGEHVLANRVALREALELPSAPRWLRQVHGTAVFDADARTIDGVLVPADADEPEADAAVTRSPGVVLAVLHADCLPVLLCSDDGAVLGAAHAGWRGLAAGVVEATFDAMRVPGERVIGWFGPAAGPANYEIGEEVRAAFVDGDAGAAAAFTATRPGHWRVDLYALARRRLAAIGVTRMHGGGRCTIGEPNGYFSHRRDARTGRMASLIWRAS